MSVQYEACRTNLLFGRGILPARTHSVNRAVSSAIGLTIGSVLLGQLAGIAYGLGSETDWLAFARHAPAILFSGELAEDTTFALLAAIAAAIAAGSFVPREQTEPREIEWAEKAKHLEGE